MHGLTDIIIGVTTHLQVEARKAGETERLAGAARVDEVKRALPAAVAVRLGDLARDARGGGGEPAPTAPGAACEACPRERTVRNSSRRRDGAQPFVRRFTEIRFVDFVRFQFQFVF